MEREDKKEIDLQESFKKAVDEGIKFALVEIEKKYERGAEQERLPFHNKAHTESVIRRTTLVLEAARSADPEAVTERVVEFGKLIAAYHDIVQNWTEKVEAHPQFGKKLVRHRFAIENETDSMDALMICMERANLNSPHGNLFSAEDIAIAREAIMATVPDYDPETKTAIQPQLNEKSSLVAKALALADLGTAGIDGPESFLVEGDALFRENNLDIAEALAEGDNSDPDAKERYRQRMLKWVQDQISFAEGRKQRLNSELEGLPENVQNEIRKLFINFDATIEAARAQLEARRSMSFEELSRSMGYGV
jgi:hypothetical protein